MIRNALINLIKLMFIFGINCICVNADTKIYNQTYGHIHTKPFSSSPSATGISCGEKVLIISSDKKIEKDWELVSFGDKKGYVYQKYLSLNKPDCLQEGYPVFFQSLELDLTEIYLWGKLSDHYIDFESGAE